MNTADLAIGNNYDINWVVIAKAEKY